MRVIDQLSFSGNTINEDAIWCSEQCALVLDGSTALNGSAYPASDFVQDFINVFSEMITKKDSLSDAVNSTVLALNNRKIMGEDSSSLQILPSAAGVFVYETDSNIQILTIGDCTAILSGEFGYRKIYSNEVERFDQKVIRRMEELHELTGADICDIVLSREIKDMLIKNRGMMNHPDGYRIISLNMKPVEKQDIVSVKKDNVDEIIMYSDGFNLMEKEIISGKLDFSVMYQMLRAKENEDSRFNTYPRFKKSDDASIISLRISHDEEQ